MKLKFYHGATMLHLKTGYRQYRVCVIAKSRKRVSELLGELGSHCPVGHIATYFSTTDGPSTPMKDKPIEESVWSSTSDYHSPFERIWPV